MNARAARPVRRAELQNEQPPAEQPKKPRKMSDYLNKIEKLKMDGNLAENWRRFKRYFDIFMRAGELMNKADEIKINTLLNCVGEEAIEVFDTFTLTEAQKESYDEVVKAFEEFCKPKKNTVYERFMFYQRKQKDGEPFDTFLMDIKRLARTCEFTDRENEMLRDQIVMGIQDKKVQLRMLEMSDLTYEKAVEKGRQGEATKEQADSMNVSRTADVNEIRRDTLHRNTNHAAENRNNNNNTERYTRNDTRGRVHNKSNNENRSDKSKCNYCNFSHKLGANNCPAYGKKCNACSRLNHFSSVCRVKNISTISFDNSSYDFDDNSQFFIGTLNKEKCENDDAYSYPWIERIGIEKSRVPHKIDTGAGADVMPLSVLKRMVREPSIQMTGITLRAFAGEKITPIGTCTLICSFRGMSLKIKFVIVDFDCTPILGLRSCIRFKIVQPSRDSLIQNKNLASKL